MAPSSSLTVLRRRLRAAYRRAADAFFERDLARVDLTQSLAAADDALGLLATARADGAALRVRVAELEAELAAVTAERDRLAARVARLTPKAKASTPARVARPSRPSRRGSAA